jgi:hypothetical protein
MPLTSISALFPPMPIIDTFLPQKHQCSLQGRSAKLPGQHNVAPTAWPVISDSRMVPVLFGIFRETEATQWLKLLGIAVNGVSIGGRLSVSRYRHDISRTCGRS